MEIFKTFEGEINSVKESLFGISNIEIINFIPPKWFKKNFDKNIELPDVKREIILKRFVGFLYESRGSKEILIPEHNMFHQEYFVAMNLYLHYLITSELDFKYIKNDINSLY